MIMAVKAGMAVSIVHDLSVSGAGALAEMMPNRNRYIKGKTSVKKTPTGSRRNSFASIQVIFNRLFISHLTLESHDRSASGRHPPGLAARSVGRGNGSPACLAD